jgi:hypothetical protein
VERDLNTDQRIMDMVRRRPCTVEEMAASLGVPQEDLQVTLADLLAREQIVRHVFDGLEYVCRKDAGGQALTRLPSKASAWGAPVNSVANPWKRGASWEAERSALFAKMKSVQERNDGWYVEGVTMASDTEMIQKLRDEDALAHFRMVSVSLFADFVPFLDQSHQRLKHHLGVKHDGQCWMLTEKMIQAVGFRNLIVHEYGKVDLGIVYRAAWEVLEDLRDFMRAVLGRFG